MTKKTCRLQNRGGIGIYRLQLITEKFTEMLWSLMRLIVITNACMNKRTDTTHDKPANHHHSSLGRRICVRLHLYHDHCNDDCA